MPNRDQMMSVGQSCSEYNAEPDADHRSCATCQHWAGAEEMCELEIFLPQLTSLDQT